MTKKELYAVYADLCCDIGKSPISFKQFLTLSIARKRAASEADFIRFVAAYKKMLTVKSAQGYAEILKTFVRLPPRQTAGFFMLMADENRKYIEYRSAISKGLSESATSQNCVAF